MKPALIYYGGKQNMLSYIMPLIPKHGCYVEPFCGGASVFFAKKNSSVEVLNDTNYNLINFYRTLQDHKKGIRLLKMCKGTLYSRTEHHRAISLFNSGSDIERAWALWFKINTGFSGKLNGGFSVTKIPGSSPGMKFTNYKQNLSMIAARLENVQIDNVDAIGCIYYYEDETTFFYLDPPYLNADQGHYTGYTEKDFKQLLNKLSDIKGKFILSCYPGPLIEDYILMNDWNTFSIQQRIRARNRNHNLENCKKYKTEMLIWNYDISVAYQQDLIF